MVRRLVDRVLGGGFGLLVLAKSENKKRVEDLDMDHVLDYAGREIPIKPIQ